MLKQYICMASLMLKQKKGEMLFGTKFFAFFSKQANYFIEALKGGFRLIVDADRHTKSSLIVPY